MKTINPRLQALLAEVPKPSWTAIRVMLPWSLFVIVSVCFSITQLC